MVAAQPRILEAQRRLTTSFDPDSGKASVDDQVAKVAFAIFKANSRDTHVFAPGMTKDQAFQRRWDALMPLTRAHYELMAQAAIRAAH